MLKKENNISQHSTSSNLHIVVTYLGDVIHSTILLLKHCKVQPPAIYIDSPVRGKTLITGGVASVDPVSWLALCT